MPDRSTGLTVLRTVMISLCLTVLIFILFYHFFSVLLSNHGTVILLFKPKTRIKTKKKYSWHSHFEVVQKIRLSIVFHEGHISFH